MIVSSTWSKDVKKEFNDTRRNFASVASNDLKMKKSSFQCDYSFSAKTLFYKTLGNSIHVVMLHTLWNILIHEPFDFVIQHFRVNSSIFFKNLLTYSMFLVFLNRLDKYDFQKIVSETRVSVISTKRGYTHSHFTYIFELLNLLILFCLVSVLTKGTTIYKVSSRYVRK